MAAVDCCDHVLLRGKATVYQVTIRAQSRGHATCLSLIVCRQEFYVQSIIDLSMAAMWSILFGFLLTYTGIVAGRVLQLPSSSSSSEHNNRPLIGILSQPGDGDENLFTNHLQPSDPRRSNISYIAASYVKFVESGGARAVPLLYNEPEESLRKKFSVINGILFPGGYASLQDGPYYRAGELLFKMALEANDNGDYLPVFGTCLGFELLVVLVTRNHSILEKFSAEKTPGPLHFAGEWAKELSLFKWLSKDILEKLEYQNLAMENHVKGMSPETWSTTQALTDFFQVLTTTPDLENKTYISTVQGRKYPVTGVQWHPENNAFEWGIATIPHGPDAIRVTHGAASFLISEARKSKHRASSEDEEKLLIYNYDPLYSGKDGEGHFDQSYVFW